MSEEQIILAKFKAGVDKYFKSIYGLTWADACGDEEPLLAALKELTKPKEFVLEWGERYDLDPID